MRRKDREITDKEMIGSVIERSHCCRLGFCDNGQVYIVPLSFGYVQKDGKDIFYFHGALQGRKIDLIRQCETVGFEMDTDYKLNEAENACDYSARFQSIIGHGYISLVDDEQEKCFGLCAIMEHYTDKRELSEKSKWKFDDKMLRAVNVFKVEVISMSCKAHG